MEVKKRRKYGMEFKEDILNMLWTGNKNIPELSKELGIALGIAEQVIYRWNRKYNGDTNKDEEKLSDQEKQLRELRIKLAEVTLRSVTY